MRSRWVVCAAVAASVLLCNPVRADLTSIFTFLADQPAYTVPVGHSVDVPVYLQEAVIPAIPPNESFLVTEDGLWTAGVLVQRTGTSLGDPAVLTNVSGNATDFDDPLFPPAPDITGDTASIFEMRDLMQPSGVLGDETFPGSGVRRILLGTFTVTAGTTVGEVTTFQVCDNSSDDTLTWTTLTLLDPSIQATSFTVTAEAAPVPVPAGVLLGLLGLGAGGMGLWRKGSGASD